MDIRRDSLLHTCFPEYDYADSFVEEIADPEDKIGIFEIAGIFLAPRPKWLDTLFALRNKIAGAFGLKTSATIGKTTDCIANRKPGAHTETLEVFARNASEIILGEDDKHLDFRISMFMERQTGKKRITVTTAIKRHNLLGRCYFFFIKPFHKVIVPHFLKYNFRKLESGPHV